MEQLRHRLFDLGRQDLSRLLGCAISEITVLNRSFYDQPDALERLTRGNEAIHRLTGHLRDLVDRGEMLSESRVDGIFEQLSLLSPRTIERVFGL
jgi:hypothetical protein